VTEPAAVTVGNLVTADDQDEPLECRRCNEIGVPRLISPYWKPDEPGLCPRCCAAAAAHFEALAEGWPILDGTRPPKLADLQQFWHDYRRFPDDEEVDRDTGLLSWRPRPNEIEEIPEW